jgi:hypothetical protein
MLSRELVIHQNTQIDCGPLSHSLDALILYRDRIRQKPSTLQTPKPPEMASNPSKTVTDGSPKTKSDPKITTEPSVDKKPTPMPPEFSVPLLNVKPLEAKPAEGPKPQEKPTDEKPSDATLNVPSISIPNPLVIPDSKPTETKPEPVGPKAEPSIKDKEKDKDKSVSAKSRTDSVFSRSDPKDTRLPKIDLSKLSNIGQVAPTVRVDDSSLGAPRPTRKEVSLPGAPALLPDLVATPLVSSHKPLSELRPEQLAKAIPTTTPAETGLREPLPAAGSSSDDQEPSDAAMAIGQHEEGPVSALEISNPE